jgi:hypothetical protein
MLCQRKDSTQPGADDTSIERVDAAWTTAAATPTTHPETNATYIRMQRTGDGRRRTRAQ